MIATVIDDSRKAVLLKDAKLQGIILICCSFGQVAQNQTQKHDNLCTSNFLSVLL